MATGDFDYWNCVHGNTGMAWVLPPEPNADKGIIANIIERLNGHDGRLIDLENLEARRPTAAEAARTAGECVKVLAAEPPPMPISSVITAENPPQ